MYIHILISRWKKSSKKHGRVSVSDVDGLAGVLCCWARARIVISYPDPSPAQLLFNLCPQGRVSIVLAIQSKNSNQCVVIISAAVFQCTNQGKILNQRLKRNSIQMLPFRNGLWRMSTMKSNPVKQA